MIIMIMKKNKKKRKLVEYQMFMLTDSNLFTEYAIFSAVIPLQIMTNCKWKTLQSLSRQNEAQFSFTDGTSGLPGVPINSFF